MAGRNVKVNIQAVEAGIRCCETAIEELNTAAQTLSTQYGSAVQTGWKDDKSRRTGEIVSYCCKALRTPIRKLESHKASLEKLRVQILEYENTQI